jgi:DNA-binding response OmpR family regulator
MGLPAETSWFAVPEPTLSTVNGFVGSGERAMAEEILIIEDDERLAAMVGDYLGKAGFRVNHHPNARDGLAVLKSNRFNALILDLMLPDMDGFDVCRRVRATSDIPILILTARGDPTDRVVGLELGADDYLAKPFNPPELLARLKAILRRRTIRTRDGTLRFGRLEIDRDAYLVRVDGRPCTLTGYQFTLLRALAEHAGKVMSRDELMDLSKGQPLDAFDRSIDVHISRIRAAIEDEAKRPRRIITVRGVGYVFARSQDGAAD